MKDWVEGDTYFKYEKESSKLRMGGGSWTIKPEKIQRPEIKKIVYITPSKRYTIDKDMIVSKAWKLNFKGEDKFVVPLRYWN